MKKKSVLFILTIVLVLSTISPTSEATNTSSPFVKAEIKTSGGVPTLWVEGKLCPPFAYMSYLDATKYYKEIAEAGIHIYCIPVFLGDRGVNSKTGIGPFREGIWKQGCCYDFSPIEKDFSALVKADPKAMVIIRLYLDVPTWWEKQYPQECCLLPDGTTLRQSFCSDFWRKQTTQVISDTIQWLAKSAYAKHLMGIHLAAGNTEEWFYHFKGNFYDNNPSRAKAFKAWLRDYYKDEESLQEAWGDDTITFDTARQADISGENKKREWRRKPEDQSTIDTFRFHTQVLVDNIIYFCKVVKTESNGQLLTGAFYGYNYRVMDTRRGHGPIDRLLRCDEVDFLSSPNDYHRVLGEDWPPMVAIQSVQLHHKLWLAENDTRTALSTPLKDQAPMIAPEGYYDSGVWLSPYDMNTSAALLRKDSARMLTHGYGGWWFDMWAGWYHDPVLLNVFKTTQQLYLQSRFDGSEPMRAQACVVIDGEMSFWDKSLGRLSKKVVSNKHTLGKLGAPYDLFSIGDWGQIDPSGYKVLWLLGVPDLDAKEEELLETWKKQNKTILWTNTEGTCVFHPKEKSIMHKAKYQWDTQELRNIWKHAGVHLYVDTDDVLYAGHGWLSIHTVEGGVRQIRFPFQVTVIDPIRKEELAKSCTSYEITLPPKSTTLLKIEQRK